MKVTKGGSSAGLAIMTRLFLESSQNSSALVFPPTEIGFATPPGNVFTFASVSSTQTCPGPQVAGGLGGVPTCGKQVPPVSPTQTSVWLLTVARPSGPEVSLLPVKPWNPLFTTCVRVGGKVDRSRMSIVLLLRSAR